MKRIAIVDDRPELVKNFKKVLEDAGHVVLMVDVFSVRGEDRVGQIAQLIKDFFPDKVLLDHDLCVFTGKELAQALDYPPEMLIGISLSPQDYCERKQGQLLLGCLPLYEGEPTDAERFLLNIG